MWIQTPIQLVWLVVLSAAGKEGSGGRDETSIDNRRAAGVDPSRVESSRVEGRGGELRRESAMMRSEGRCGWCRVDTEERMRMCGCVGVWVCGRVMRDGCVAARKE